MSCFKPYWFSKHTDFTVIPKELPLKWPQNRGRKPHESLFRNEIEHCHYLTYLMIVFKTVTRIIGWLSIFLMNAILHRAHSSGYKHIPALPLALVGNSFLKNLLTSELWMFLRMTSFFLSWWSEDLLLTSPTETPWVIEMNSWGEPGDEQLSPWPHWALSGTIIKPQTWFYHSWKELQTPACTTYSIFLTGRLQQQQRNGRGSARASPLAVQRYPLSCSSSLDRPSSGSKQSWWAVSWRE